jgi:hypothetical protein
MLLVIPTAIKNDRWYESFFGAPPPANPARDTNRRNRWKSQRFRRLVSDARAWITAQQIAEQRAVDAGSDASHDPTGKLDRAVS